MNTAQSSRTWRSIVGRAVCDCGVTIGMGLICGAAAATVPQAHLVKDIYPGRAPLASGPRDLFTLGNWVVFTADDGIHGRSLFRTDGTAEGTGLLMAASASSVPIAPTRFVQAPDLLYFVARDPAGVTQLWRTDATPDGTFPLVPILPDPIEPIGSVGAGDLHDYVLNGDILFFVANDGVHGCELWRSDGTVAGTFLVKDTYPEAVCAVRLQPDPLQAVAYIAPQSLTMLDGTLYFTADDVLWKSDGTETGTVPVYRFGRQCVGENIFDCPPSCLTAVGHLLYFAAEQYDTGREPWISDGTERGTTLLRDLNPTTCVRGADPARCSSFACGFEEYEGGVLFTAYGSDRQYRRWITDGTAAGTVPFSGGGPTPTPTPDALHPPGQSATLNGKILLGRDELYVSDGTEAGTVLLKDLTELPNDSHPRLFTELNGALLFVADDGIHGAELWRSDGHEDTTVLVRDVNPGPGGANYAKFTPSGDHVFFAADDGTHGFELWVTDGTSDGTHLVKDIFPGPADALDPYDLRDDFCRWTVVGDLLFFCAIDGTHGRELWRTDGTAAGTQLVKDIFPGSSDAYPLDLVSWQGILLFTADDAEHGRRLWRSDGTEVGTRLVTDANLNGPFEERLYGLTSFVDGVYFYGVNADSVSYVDDYWALWRTDGTASGTTRVAPDFRPPPFQWDQRPPVSGAGKYLYFLAAHQFDWPYDVWRTDGTSAGSIRLTTFTHRLLSFMLPAQEQLFFAIRDDYTTPLSTFELWHTDGTVAGTVQLLHQESMQGVWARLFAVAGAELYLAVSDPATGATLWASDGTVAGTAPVNDVFDPTAVPGVNDVARLVDGTLYFSAADDRGAELWALPLACAGDCNADYSVTVDEVVAAVGIALGSVPLDRCTRADVDGDHHVTVDEAIAAVERALVGCR